MSIQLLTLTGPSCSGKTTLLNDLVNNHGYKSIVSHTTRPMRPGEKESVDYYFISGKQFDTMLADNEFIESIEFNGYKYGVSVKEIVRAGKSGMPVVLIVEPNGVQQILLQLAKAETLVGEKINLKKVYISGSIESLLTRYVHRLAGEDLKDPLVAKRHGTRIASMLEEVKAWYPRGSGPFWALKYEMILPYLDESNTQETINKIKELQKNDSKNESRALG